MGRIKKLSPLEAQKIAAGEVVERPANVVKELLENALDAQATAITLYIKDGGKELIRVVDNGTGMAADDAHACFEHHATSKITTVDDLISIASFGFRGEALSSICSVSKVTLITKDEKSSHGIKIVHQDGIVVHEENVSAPTGTDITVEQLFYNVPARKKFLKTRDTEWRAIVHLFQAIALDYRSIHFKCISEGAILFNCPPTDSLPTRVAQLWDHAMAENMIELTASPLKHEFAISGIISNQQYARYDRSTIFFFVNGRWIKNPDLGKALLKGYANVITPEKFPAACIFIACNPAHIDINIHPRKEEVQFLNPKVVEHTLQDQVKTSLEQHLSQHLARPVQLSPAMPFNSATYSRQTFTPSKPYNTPLYANNSFAQEVAPSSYKELPVIPSEPLVADIQQPAFAQSPEEQLEPIEYHIIGQLNKTYILLDHADGLFMVDQHAAHERILYELFEKRFEEVPTIKLIFPPIITLTQADLDLLEPHFSVFKAHALEVERFSHNQVTIHSAPVHLKQAPFDELVKQTVGWIKELDGIDKDQFIKQLHEKLRAQMACKAAVKAGDVLTMIQMQELISTLYKTENRFTCPHGRPTGWLISTYEIEKKFKRK